MHIRELWPRSPLKAIAVGLALVVAAAFASYLFLLAMEAYSARAASKMLDRLGPLRMGDSAKQFQQAVRGCGIEKSGDDSLCIVTAGAFRFPLPWKLLWKLPNDWPYRATDFLDGAGLRYWRLVADASVHDGRIQQLSLHLFVVGRYESLGAEWAISDHVPERYLKFMHLSSLEQRTYIGWFHITSIPSGEGFRIHATADSTAKELRARRINRECLFSFRGCDGLCELLPDAIPVLNDRNRGGGGWTSVPPARCDSEIKYYRTMLKNNQ